MNDDGDYKTLHKNAELLPLDHNTSQSYMPWTTTQARVTGLEEMLVCLFNSVSLLKN